ncbi:MAG: glycosyltransferase [archaeon]
MKWIAGVCAYDELPCLRALEPTLPGRAVFAVDGTDGSAEFLRKRKRTVLASKGRLGKAAAVSRILKYARERGIDAVVFIQADDWVGKDFFREILKPLGSANPGVGISVAKVMPASGKNFCGFFGRLNWEMHNAFGARGKPKAGEAFAIKARAAPEIVPDGTINDDAFLQAFSESRGFSTVYSPKATVFLTPPENVWELFTQRMRIAAGHFQLVFSGKRVPTISPVERLRVFVETAPGICSGPDELFFSILSVPFEAFSFSAGFLFSICKMGSLARWDSPKSTKKPFAGEKLGKT